MNVASSLLQQFGRCGSLKRSVTCARRTSTTTTASSATPKLTTISVDADTAIATLTLNRPPANALSIDLMRQIRQAIQELERQQCRGIILTSASERIFSAGLDLRACYKSDEERLAMLWCALQNMWRATFATAIPMAALINGHALGGGCVLATACDYRVMLPNFTIGFIETRAGIAVSRWVIDSYVNVLPSRRRAEADLIAGTSYTSTDALQVGLVDALAMTKQDAMQKCLEFFRSFDERTWTARALTKQQFRAPILEDFDKDRQRDLRLFVDGIQQVDVQAFLAEYLQSLKQKKSK